MSKIYRLYCRTEEAIVGVGFAAIVLLTFSNAVLRVFDRPIIYSDDLCLMLFSWTALLGADVAMRHSRLVGMDILTSKLSPKVQKALGILVNVIMIFILITLVRGGIKIIGVNGDRPFNTLGAFGIRYSAVTMALPIGGVMMVFTCLMKIGKLFIHFKDDAYNIKHDVPDKNIGEENTGLDEESVDLEGIMEAKKV
ncbi:MAG: TRAP transporter small permease [Eubacteriales bacterium]|nr:TRAP transporter small permease [Eubacteriales bacterium]